MNDDETRDAEHDEPAILPFAAWLQDVRAGRLHAEVTDAFHALIDAVSQHHAAGELILKLKVKPADAGGAQVIVTDDVVLKIPTAQRPMSLYYVDDANNLLRDDPSRPQLPLREVPVATAADLREAGQ